jgi:16S rRNA (uracil1498-N3)-methyltransferase
MQTGSEVELFNGKGCRGTATVLSVHKNATVVKTAELESVSLKRETRITLATSLPKGDRQKWLIEKLTELGVDRVIPLETERGVAQPTDSALERLERVALEACKQSRNEWLLQIDPPVAWSELDRVLKPNTLKLIAHPYPVSKRMGATENSGQESGKNRPLSPLPVVVGMRALQQWLPQTFPPEIVVAIGPEGGFTDDEVEFTLQHDWLPWILTHNILRVETAVMMSAILTIDYVTQP